MNYSNIYKLPKHCCICVLMYIFSNGALADDLDNYIAEKMQVARIPGLQLAIVKNGTLIKHASYGTANIQDAVAVTDNTLFTVNSMTKSFTGVAMMQLVEAGKIQLTDKVSKFITDLPRTWRDVTIHQLLTNTSGLPDIMPGVKLISYEGESASWALVQTLPVTSKPNTRFEYCATNYLLLGKIIERVSGQKVSEYIQAHQLQKLPMPLTLAAGFDHFQGVIPNQARGYTYYFGGKLTTIQVEIPTFLHAAVGMSSTALEIAQWTIALQKNALLAQSSSIQALWSPAILGNGRTQGFDKLLNGYALGWQVINRATHPAVASVGGDRSALMIYPLDKLTVVVLTNLMGAKPEAFIDEIAGFYIEDMSEINGLTVPSDILDRYVGNYKFSQFSLSLSLVAGRLSVLAGGPGQEPFTLFAETDRRFFSKAIDAKFEFVRDEVSLKDILIVYQNGEVYRGERN